MRIVSSLPILLTLFTCQSTTAQEPAIAPNAQPVGPQKPVQQYYVEDGALTVECSRALSSRRK